MKIPGLSRYVNLAIGFLIGVLVAGATVAVASIPNSTSGEITGCYSMRNGALRVIDAEANQTCAKNETQIRWNQEGPQGPPGVGGASDPRILYAFLDYRLTTEGCSPGHLKFVRSNTLGTNPEVLPSSTPCIAPVLSRYGDAMYGYTEVVLWEVTIPANHTNNRRIHIEYYQPTENIVVFGPDAPESIRGLNMGVGLGDQDSLGTFHFSISRRAQTEPLTSLAEIAVNWAIDQGVQPNPLALYQMPE